MAVSCCDQAVRAQVRQVSRHDLAGRADSIGNLLLGHLRLQQPGGQLVAAGPLEEIERHPLLDGSEGVHADRSNGVRVANGEIRRDGAPQSRVGDHSAPHCQ